MYNPMTEKPEMDTYLSAVMYEYITSWSLLSLLKPLLYDTS